MDQAGILSTVHYSHAPFTDLLQNLVMANGRADHTIPPTCAVQLPAMLRREAAKDNGKQVVGFGTHLVLFRSAYGWVYGTGQWVRGRAL